MTGLSVGESLFSTQPVLATDNDSIVFFTVENLCTSQWNVLHSDFTCLKLQLSFSPKPNSFLSSTFWRNR